MVTPGSTQLLGAVVSALTAIAVGAAAYFTLNYLLDFWYIGEVLGAMAGIFLGGLSGIAMFVKGLRSIDLNWVGVALFLGRPTGRIYGTGVHWVSPLHGIRNVPDSSKKFILAMDGEKIDAQDGATIYFGLEEDGGKLNEVQYSVVNPILYIGIDDPETELRTAYLEEARFFFAQSEAAIGVKNEKTLFSDFIMLPIGTSPDDPFKQRLEEALFVRREDNPNAEPKQPERLYDKAAVEAIMAKAGTFLRKTAEWGLGNIVAFTPNVRENPVTEAATAEKQAEFERMKALDTRAKKVTELARDMREQTGMSPDLAGTLVASLQGQKVNVNNTTYTVSGFPDVIKALGEKAIDALAKKPETK